MEQKLEKIASEALQMSAGARAYLAEILRESLDFLPEKPELRVQSAIYRYQQEDISLAKAAALAGVTWQQMKEILLEKGIQPRLGHDNLADAEAEILSAREYLKHNS